MIKIIAALSKDNIIGVNNTLPWYIKSDLQRFKKYTTNNVVVMGRNTYESIGKLLPNRINIIVSKDHCNINDVKEHVKKLSSVYDVYIIGGVNIWKEFIPITDQAIITRVDTYIKNGLKFPIYHFNRYFRIVDEKFIVPDKKDQFNTTVEFYAKSNSK